MGSVEDGISTNMRPTQGASSRSSSRGAPGSRSSRDPRPVGDKAYAAQCARTVVDFLAARGFGRTIPYEKFLREPMTKDFFEVFKFLMAQLDPLMEIDGKIEDEVPFIMRRLRYPVEVNKSKLQSICGPNTWPQLLAVLDWLIVLIQVNDCLIEPFAVCKLGLSEDDNELDANHHLLRTLHNNYIDFLAGKDGNFAEESLRQVYNDRAAFVQAEVDRLQAQTSNIEAQLQELRAEHERLLEIQAAPHQLAIEADRLRGVIQAQESRAQRAEEEVVELEAEDTNIDAEIKNLEVGNRKLLDQVESQPFSKRDIERLKSHRAQLRAQLEDLKTDAEKTEQGVWELSMEERTLEETITRAARFVNDKAETVEGMASGSCDEISAEELRVDVDLSDATDALAALDFSKFGKRMLRVVESRNEAVRREEASVHQIGEQLRVVQEDLAQKEREVQRLKVRQEQLTRIREERRVWSESQLDDARQTAEAAEDAVRKAAMDTEAPTVRDHAEVDELRLELQNLKSNCEAERAAMEESVRKEQESIGFYQKSVQKEMTLAKESMQQLRSDVETRVAELGVVDAAEIRPSRGGC